MQYSSNSNAAIVGEIRSACTLAGQYRKAVMIATDKDYTLNAYRLERQKQELEIQRMGLKAREAESTDPLLAQQIRIDIELLKLQMAQSDALLEDAVRERSVATAEMQQICDEAGIDFDSLPSAEFQELMADEYRERQLRYQLAGIYAAQVGMPIDRMEALLELPQADLLAIAARLQPLIHQNPIRLLEAAANGPN